jgi:hypothetical protein
MNDKPKLTELKERPEVIAQTEWDLLIAEHAKVWAVGSRSIEGAFRADSDYDFLVFSGQPIPHVFSGMGFELETGGAHYEPSEGGFNSWRKGSVNFVATYSPKFCADFLKANTIAQRLKLKDRDDRVTLFKAILYNDLPVEIPNASIRWEWEPTEDDIPF